MPAVASFTRGKISITSWPAGVRARLFHFRLLASRTKIDASYKPRTKVRPLDGVVIPDYHVGDGSYLELSDSRHTGNYELGMVKTDIARGG